MYICVLYTCMYECPCSCVCIRTYVVSVCYMYLCMYMYVHMCLHSCVCVHTVEHSYNKPEILGQTVCYDQKFVIILSDQFPIRYCSTWLRSLLCIIKKFVIEEFVIRVFHCILR